MWVETEDGRLVNLDHARDIVDVRGQGEEQRLVARFPEGNGEVTLFAGSDTGAAYQEIRGGLLKDADFVDLRLRKLKKK